MQWSCWHGPAKMSLGFLCLFLVYNTASCMRREHKKEKHVAVLATAELSAKSVDLAALNLTELVNSMLDTALRGTKKLFSLLSVTSYSSFAFHKVSVTIYNISNVKNVDPGKFPMHYCYCLSNVTNDLTDFTALLVDIIGNSTSYLTEIFKSTSILSVHQSNDSDCTYICVMTGQTGRNLSDFWETVENSPIINYTFSSNTSSDLDSAFSGLTKLQEDQKRTVDPSAEHVWRFKTTRSPLALKGEEIPFTRFPPWPKTSGAKGSGFPSPNVDAPRPRGTDGAPPAAGGMWAPWPALQPSPADTAAIWMQTASPQETRKLMQTEPDLPSSVMSTPPYRPEVTMKFYSATRCPQAVLKETPVTSPPITLLVQKINPCVMELCRFFQLCLCVGQRRHSRKETMRYCVEYYSWFLKNANYVCERVKRVAYSHTLKQKCLKNICTFV
ncbi:HERV-H LTR-associating protein 1 [Heliangelus exortis]|uniref:HERV-H LTR-associating protein 1 n=1 Tax=Heliangelus exortis TaxID=472823 RepID=UPI003A916E19